MRLDAVGDLEVLRRRLDGIAVGLIGNVDRTPAAGSAGYANVAGFLRAEHGVPRPEANRRATLARRLGDRVSMDAVAQALVEGRIGFAQAQLIGKYSVRDEVAWAFDGAVEAVFLPIAEQKDFKFFERAMAEWFEHHDDS